MSNKEGLPSWDTREAKLIELGGTREDIEEMKQENMRFLREQITRIEGMISKFEQKGLPAETLALFMQPYETDLTEYKTRLEEYESKGAESFGE